MVTEIVTIASALATSGIVVFAVGRKVQRYVDRLEVTNGKLRELVATVERDARRNWVHHTLMFDKLEVSRQEVLEAEAAAGCGRKP